MKEMLCPHCNQKNIVSLEHVFQKKCEKCNRKIVESLYDALEINREATQEEIKKNYRKLALKWHPDKNKENEEEATKKFLELKEAYDVLSNPLEKTKYDEELERKIENLIVKEEKKQTNQTNNYNDYRERVYQFAAELAYYNLSRRAILKRLLKENVPEDIAKEISEIAVNYRKKENRKMMLKTLGISSLWLVVILIAAFCAYYFIPDKLLSKCAAVVVLGMFWRMYVQYFKSIYCLMMGKRMFK